MTNDEVMEWVKFNHSKYPDLAYAGGALLDECLKRNSRDNMTVCIVGITLPPVAPEVAEAMLAEMKVREDEARKRDEEERMKDRSGYDSS
jgi:hypothetical protein